MELFARCAGKISTSRARCAHGSNGRSIFSTTLSRVVFQEFILRCISIPCYPNKHPALPSLIHTRPSPSHSLCHPSERAFPTHLCLRLARHAAVELVPARGRAEVDAAVDTVQQPSVLRCALHPIILLLTPVRRLTTFVPLPHTHWQSPIGVRRAVAFAVDHIVRLGGIQRARARSDSLSCEWNWAPSPSLSLRLVIRSSRTRRAAPGPRPRSLLAWCWRLSGSLGGNPRSDGWQSWSASSTRKSRCELGCTPSASQTAQYSRYAFLAAAPSAHSHTDHHHHF